MLDGTAGGRANEPVMPSDMAGNAADRSTLETTRRTGHRRKHCDRRSEHQSKDYFAHIDLFKSAG